MATINSTAPKPRIALSLQGDPTKAGAWSGVPAGLISGLKAANCDVIPVNAIFPGAGRLAHLLKMSWADQSANRGFAWACGMAADRALSAAGDLDGIVMIGSGYSLSSEVPIVTFEDMTVAQSLRRSDPVYDTLSDAARKHWIDRQRRIYEHSRACCAVSGWTATSIQEDYGISGSKVHIVGFGNNIDVGQVDRDWTVPRFLYVGSDWVRKRGAAVVEAFTKVRQRHPHASLDLVGDHPPIDVEGVTAHGLLPLGSPEGQSEYVNLLHRATCFLMPSTYEPFGIAYIDAAKAGVPSIGTTVGGASDAIGNGGKVVDPTDQEALTAAMLELSDPLTARRLGEQAKTHSELLTWRAVAERLLRALRPPGIDIDRLSPFLDTHEQSVKT